jgi:hypothetical protein
MLLAASPIGLAACDELTDSDPSLAAFQLERMPANAACEGFQGQLRTVKFIITPGEPVTAEFDNGLVVPTEWDEGFVPDPLGERLIRDRAGNVVARDGQIIAIPERDWPTLLGHLVCISLNVVWIFDEGPP